MTEQEIESFDCDLNLVLLWSGLVTATYDSENGFRQRFVILGRVDDPDCYYPDFRDKPVRIKIFSPPGTGIFRKFLSATQAGKACGFAIICAGVEPERYEADEEPIEDEPIEIEIEVSPDAFSAIRHQTEGASALGRVIFAKITLAVEPPENMRGKRLASVNLNDLDISQDNGYPVTHFEIFDTYRHFVPQNRVLPLECKDDQLTRLSVLLTAAHYHVDFERGRFHAVQCGGTVIHARGKPYDSASVSVDFESRYLPVRSTVQVREVFGDFLYWPKSPEYENEPAQFRLQLKYLPEDASGFLLPLLGQVDAGQVILTVELMTGEQALALETGDLAGQVRTYGLGVRKTLRSSERD